MLLALMLFLMLEEADYAKNFAGIMGLALFYHWLTPKEAFVLSQWWLRCTLCTAVHGSRCTGVAEHNEDIPRHPDTRLFEVRDALNSVRYLIFRRIFAHTDISHFFASGGHPGALPGPSREPLRQACA